LAEPAASSDDDETGLPPSGYPRRSGAEPTIGMGNSSADDDGPAIPVDPVTAEAMRHSMHGSPGERPPLSPRTSWSIILVVGAAVWFSGAVLSGAWVPTAGWRILSVFVPTVLAMMLRPVPAGAAVLLGVIALIPVAGLKTEEALGGYADRVVWLVLAAYFLSRAFLKTGLARRIALVFIRALGGSSLGLAYGLAGADAVLAAMIPSNAARVGGVILPVARSLCELFDSRPGASAGRLGLFLMLTLYQIDVVCCATFMTGQAGNAQAVTEANKTLEAAGAEFRLGYAPWLMCSLPPALISLALVPLVTRWFAPPTLSDTPQARAFADEELRRLGPLNRGEWILLTVFATVCTGWVTLPSERTADLALGGAAALLLLGVLRWDDILDERHAWDVFLWYGGVVQMGKLLDRSGIIRDFAGLVAGHLDGFSWPMLTVLTLLVYFYAHYAFASITTHVIAMYPAFLAVLIAAGAPPTLTAVSFAMLANLSACLTHYGTTPGPIIFGLGYVPQGVWWRVGFVLSTLHLAVWLTVGWGWWKLLGLW
jgi:DASS family divalent anion:Na+ symporter